MERYAIKTDDMATEDAYFMNSFNIPEMVKSKVEVSRRELLDKLFDDKQLKVVPRI